MSKWGLFTGADLPLPHTAPCSDDGDLLPPHDLSFECVCQPFVAEDDGVRTIVHNDPERGGCDA